MSHALSGVPISNIAAIYRKGLIKNFKKLLSFETSNFILLGVLTNIL